MIIKKKYAQTNQVTSSAHAIEDFKSVAQPAVVDPYQMPLSPEDFHGGQLPDRRRTDRRQGFRRIEDQELISKAHEEANAIREAAAQEGFEEGLQLAENTVKELQDAIMSLLQARDQALISASDALGSMAIEIAERIIKTEVSCDENLVMHIVRGTVAKVGREQKSITIKVNPLDLKLVKETMATDSQLSSSVEVMVVDDETVDPGSCMIETQAGLIDARFSTQIDVLKRLLLTGGKF